jgi:hypothetical protein
MGVEGICKKGCEKRMNTIGGKQGAKISKKIGI